MSATKTNGQAKKVNTVETGSKFTTAVKDSLANDLIKQGWTDTWAQILGAKGESSYTETSSHGASGDLAPGEILNLSKLRERPDVKARAASQKAETQRYIEPGINYHRDIVHSSENSNRRQLSEMEQKFAQIHQELQRLVDSSSKIVQDEFAGVTISHAPKSVGTYHINFLEWMLIAIRTARQKVEDSGAWLTAMKSKKGQRGYQQMAKTHGTSFSMSNERQVATQTG